MEELLNLWRAQIADLEARARSAGPRANFNLHQRIDEIKARCAMTQAKLDKLNSGIE